MRAFLVDVATLAAVFVLIFLLMKVSSDAVTVVTRRPAVEIPTGPCPNAWHPYIDDCKRWSI